MKPLHLKQTEAKLIKFGAKQIFAYPLETKLMSVAYMKIEGRHPNGDKYLFERDCQFVIFITKGSAKVFINNSIYNVEVGDVLYVPSQTRFAVEGNVEYVTFDTPGYYPEQSEEVE
jgi:mannose-6-phosphate isomerase-like protein (cupin superfamily)